MVSPTAGSSWSLLRRLDEPDVGGLVLTPNVAEVEGRIARLPAAVAARVRAAAPPPDPVLFGLLEIAGSAVTKGGFMQVTETLSLRTPVIAFWYDLDYSAAQLPEVLRPFTHPTRQAEADAATVAAARAFLRLGAELTAVHDGGFGAAGMAAEFIEGLSRTPRPDASADAARLGFTARRMRQALRRLDPSPVVHQIRASHLRTMADHDLYTVLCECTLGGERRFVRLWGRVFRGGARTAAAAALGSAVDPPRRILSARGQITIEVDLGEGFLPPVKEVQLEGAVRRGPFGRRRSRSLPGEADR